MSPQSEMPPVGAVNTLRQEYSAEERQLLLELAHEAIVSALEKREFPAMNFTSHLSERRGVFTTLYHDRKLRGCVGYPTALLPLYQTVIETARSSAFEDPRFTPVTRDEALQLRISISVLSAPSPISPDQVEVGRYGLLVGDGARRGLLLPQVATEHGWDRITFLEQTCRKAGLPQDAWKNGATIEGFTAEVFGDEELRA